MTTMMTVTSELKEYDDTEIVEDNLETPQALFDELCKIHQLIPELDVAADDNGSNSKCKYHLLDALSESWNYPKYTETAWCNPPHSKTEEFVKRAESQWQIHNINIMMIVPANAICAHFFDYTFEEGHARYYRISGRPRFLFKGRPTKHHSRNSYFVVVWRKR